MAGSQLVRTVFVLDEHGTAHVFHPGDDVPDWARAKIRNPSAWADAADIPASADDGATSSTLAPGPDTAPSPAEPTPAPSAQPTPGSATAGATPPPRTGRGSGRDAWAAYAEAHGVDTDPADSRDEIIAALEAAEVPTS